MLRVSLSKSEQMCGGCFLRQYPKISSKERLNRWMKRVHRRTRIDGRPIRMQVPARIQQDQKLPDAWVNLHADGIVIHSSTMTKLGQAS